MLLSWKHLCLTPVVRTSALLLDVSSFFFSTCRVIISPRAGWVSTAGRPVVSVMIGKSISQSINRSITRSGSRSINQSIGQSINQSVYRSIDQSINLSVNRSISQSVNQSISRSVYHGAGRTTDDGPTNLIQYILFVLLLTLILI